MQSFALAARAHIRTLALCSLVLTLAACGADGTSSSSSGAVSSGTTSLVESNVGVIDRGTDVPATASLHSPVSTDTVITGNPPPTEPTVTPTPPVASNPPAPAPSPPPVTPSPKPPVTPSPPPTASTGNATLDWLPPTQNADGSTLTNLAGYTVYYGTSPLNLTQSLKITNPGLTAYTMTNLASGTWYFSVTAYSSTGVESARTAVVSIKI